MSARVTEGLENRGEGSRIEIVRFQKHPTEYAAEWLQSLFYALHAVKGISASAKVLLVGYVGLKDSEGRVRMSGHEMALECELAYSTFEKAKRELLDQGLIYKGRPSHRRTDPEEIYVGDFVDRILNSDADRKTVNDVADRNSVSDLYHAREGNESASEAGASLSFESCIISQDRVDSTLEGTLNVRKEKNLPASNPLLGGIDTLDAAFDETPKVERPKTLSLTTSRGSFKLTPPNVERPAPAKRPKQKRVKPIAPEYVDRMVKLCYGVMTPEQWLTLSKRSLARCSAVVSKLIEAGADLTQWDDWERYWWSFATTRPVPETVADNWWKGVEKADQLGRIKTGLVVGSLKGQDAENAKRILAEEEHNIDRALFAQGLDRDETLSRKDKARIMIQWEREQRGQGYGKGVK